MSKLVKQGSNSLITEVFFGNGSGGGGGGVSVLNDLADVTAPSPSDQDILIFDANSGQWVTTPVSSIASPPAPPEKAIQYNKNNQFAGDSLFIYDDSNHYVGLGTSSPAVNLHVLGVGQNWSGLLMEGTDYASIRMKTNSGDFMWTSLPGGKFSLYEWSTNKYLITINTHAQMKFGGLYNNSVLEASATFEVADPGTYTGEPHRGSLPAPRMNTSDRDSISNPACGLLVLNTDTNLYNVYNCGTSNSWQSFLVGAALTSGKVLYSKDGVIAEDTPFEYDDVDKRIKAEKITIGAGVPANQEHTSIYLKGDGQNAIKFFNDLGTGSDGYKFIAYFSRFEPGQGNAGFYAGYYVLSGNVAYTLLYAPGARDFALTTYHSGQGITHPSLYIKDSNGNIGINTRTPDAKLHVAADAGLMAKFATTTSYGGISVEVPNVTAGHRVSARFGTGGGATSSALLAYKHDNTEPAMEIFVGPAPPGNTPLFRVTNAKVNLQSTDIWWTTPTTQPLNKWQLISVKRDQFDTGWQPKLVIGAQTIDTHGRLNFSVAVNTDTINVGASPTVDSVWYIEGSTKNTGIQNIKPKTTLDIRGAYRALASAPPNPEDHARFTYTTWHTDFVQFARASIPEMFRHAFEFQPLLKDVLSFVDMDMWHLGQPQSLPDFGSWNFSWSSSSPTPGTMLAARYSWGKAIRFRTSLSGRYVTAKIENLDNDMWYLIILSIYQFANSGTAKHSVMSLEPDNPDGLRVYYENNNLYLQNTQSGDNVIISHFNTNESIVIGILTQASNNKVTVISSRWSSGTNYISRHVLNNTTFPPSSPNTVGITIGQKNEAESPMNMDVHAFAMLAYPSKGMANEYVYRMVKRFAKLLI